MSDDLLKQRKDHHIDVVLEKPVAGQPLLAGFGRYTLEYDALPEVDLDEVDLSTEILGRKLNAPLMIGAMTGGTDRTGDINRILARAAARVGVGMALGSQRAMIVHPEVSSSFRVRDHAPDLPLLIGNVGAVQLNYGVGAEEVNRALEEVSADAVNIHINPLQEAIQPEGDTRFKGLLDKLPGFIEELKVPAFVKEVGSGLSQRTLGKLQGLPIAGVEVAGTGGTSWAAVEAYRASEGGRQRRTGIRLAAFGVPTPTSIRMAREAFPDRLVVGSGGVRTGLDVAVAIALGADVVGLAKPLLEAAVEGEDAVVAALEDIIYELKVLCFCTGARNLSELSRVRVLDVLNGHAPIG